MPHLKKRHIIMGVALIALAVIAALLSRRAFEPEIVSVVPNNGAVDVLLGSQIDIVFRNSVPEEEQEKFFVRLVPGVPSTPVWVSNKFLKIVPSSQLTSETTYRITVLYDGEEIHTSSFSTRYIKTYTTEEIDVIQNMALETAAAFYQLDDTYPFLKNTPLEADNYRVVFDFDRDEFRVRLKMPVTAPEETQQEALDAALQSMRDVGIVVEDYGYYVLYSE